MKPIKTSVAIVACMHGDEIAGKYVIDTLKKDPYIRNRVGFFIAHPEALKLKKRFIEKDLNRSFPGKKKGITEEKLAYKLRNELKKFDIVIDLHATNSNIDSLIIVTGLGTKIKKLLKLIPIRKVAFINKKVFGGKEMIRYCKIGASLEYGPDKSGRNYKKILKHVKIMLSNIGIINGRKRLSSLKTLYRVSGVYPVKKNFRQNGGLYDFRFIKKGQIIGRIPDKYVKSNRNFYPLFLGKGRYKDTFALISPRKELLKV